ncbi:MAG: TVP38/TMEM64 family protein [Archangiaceae bacterium]|nr:TVP38/TMEM64 family protein [Archangiaceae bacterium]
MATTPGPEGVERTNLLGRVARVALGLAVLAGIVAVFTVLPGRQWVLSTVELIRGAGPIGVAVYAAVYVLVAVFMLPGSMMTVTAGFAFGPVMGVVWGSTLAAVVGVVPFYLGRFVARDWVQRRAAQYPRWAAIDQAVGEQGLRVTLLLRLSLAPYNLLNYALGLTRMRVLDFFIGTWLGMLPAVVVLVYLGSLITDAAQVGSAFHSPQIRVLYWVGFPTTVVGAVLLTRMARKALRKVLDGGRAG